LSVTDTPEPPRPTAGVDWASADHAVTIVDADGEQIDRFPVAHDAAGLGILVRRNAAPVFCNDFGWVCYGYLGGLFRTHVRLRRRRSSAVP